MKWVSAVVLVGVALSATPAEIASRFSQTDTLLAADPASPEWQAVPGVFAANDSRGRPVPGHRTEIRSRWTRRNLYVLFICPYENLYGKPNPATTSETNQLWNWDVAEIFVGSDFDHITRYKEFEVSPQGEWVDLDIDRQHPLPAGGWLWNSGFRCKTRIDETAKVWYGEMQIPFQSISPKPPSAGQQFRVNFYRMQGPPPKRKNIAWQPTQSSNFHVPESFGILKLERGR